MGILSSNLEPASEEFAADRAAMLELLDEVAQAAVEVIAAGGEASVKRHHDRGKLTARERVDLVLDIDASFLEIAPYAGATEINEQIGARVIVGIGEVEGTECMIIANEPTVKAGAMSPRSTSKYLRGLEIARVNNLPTILLVESGGGDLPRQAESFVPGGAVFRNITRLSAQGIPVVAVVFGNSTAGGAYLPGLSEYTILVRGRAKVFLGGPPLVKMAINEEVDDETLGGAQMHASTSGLGDYLAEDERDGLRLAREVIVDLGWRKKGPGPQAVAGEPRFAADDLLACAASDTRRLTDTREILARILDDSRFNEFKPNYGPQLVTGWGSINGYSVGVLANNGILFSPESRKGAHFIQLANARNVPLLFVQNITGFMVGTAAEHGGIVRDGAAMINAVSNSTVPHLTLMVGASYGAGNYGMSGRAFEPRFVFTWPNHRIAVMGGKQLAGVMSIIRSEAAVHAGATLDADAEATLTSDLEAAIESQSTAMFATGHLWDDGIIDPRDTRTVLTLALSAAHSAPLTGADRFAPFRL